MAKKEQLMRTIPLRGGCNTADDIALIKSGGYSMIQNKRSRHPGFEQRLGCRKLHTTADSTNKVLSIFQFNKGKKTESHLYAQMGDDDILEAAAMPPTVTTGAFGSEVFSGSSGSIPASWCVINDIMLFSNGVDQHKIYPGLATPVDQFMMVKGGAAISMFPALGTDYTVEVSDGLSTTFAELDSLGDLAVDYDAIFIMTTVPAKAFNFTVVNANATAAVFQMHYHKAAAWSAASAGFADGTDTGGACLAKSGAISFTPPTDVEPCYMFGQSGFWYRLSLSSGDLDSDTTVSEVTYEADWQSIQNVWDGVLVDIIEAQLYNSTKATYSTHAASLIDLTGMIAADKLYLSSFDKVTAFYFDVGVTPNATASTAITIKYWDGSAWQAASGTDFSGGLMHSGYFFIPRHPGQPQMFNGTQYYAHWYEISTDKTFTGVTATASQQISAAVAPYYDLTDFGTKGICNDVWKDRAVYVFDQNPSWLNFSAKWAPMTLNGDDFGVIQAGDGRAHKIVCIKKFHNELMVWQTEKGLEGGCLTLIEGYSPVTFGKLVISSKLGTFNANSAVVVDGVLTSTKTDEQIKTLAFALSHYGVYASDGRSCSIVSDKIQNYFDPQKAECIRKGYENEMWLAHDSANNCLRLGLVSGATATVCNVFPVFDLTDKTWSFDVHAFPLASFTEIEAGSGAVNILQIAGGVADGQIYQANYGSLDVATAITSYVRMELEGNGVPINLREIIIRHAAVAGSTGSITITPYLNGIAGTAKSLAKAPEITSQVIRRHRFPFNVASQHISLKIENAVSGEGVFLYDMAARLIAYDNQ